MERGRKGRHRYIVCCYIDLRVKLNKKNGVMLFLFFLNNRTEACLPFTLFSDARKRFYVRLMFQCRLKSQDAENSSMTSLRFLKRQCSVYQMKKTKISYSIIISRLSKIISLQ